jgi:D-alanyl-D-alanine carboxypeptidase (penicillin-binding protein 5/6)
MIQVNSENRLLGKYPGIIGVKPGYTSLAHNTDIVAAQRDGRTILVTLMGVPHPTVTNEAAAFLDWGFAHDGLVAPVGRLVDPISASELSPDDDGVAITPVHEVMPNRPTPTVAEVTRKDDLRWSAVSGAAAVALAITAGLVRVIDRRRGRRGIAVN